MSPNCDPWEIIDRVTSLMGSGFQKQTVKVLFEEPDDFAETYILLDDPETVKRLRKQAFTSESIEGGGGIEALPKGPTKGKLNFSSFSDENGVNWRHNGEDWIPTSIDMYYVDEDSFSGRSDEKIVVTFASGQIVLITQIIPVIRKDSDTILDWEKRIVALENRSVKIIPVFRAFISFDSHGSGDHRYTTYSIVKDRRGNSVWSMLEKPHYMRKSSVYTLKGGDRKRGIKIPLKSGQNISNTLCTLSGVGGRFNDSGQYAYIHIHKGQYHFVGMNTKDPGGLVLVQCFQTYTDD